MKKDYATTAVIEDQYKETYSQGVTAYSTVYYSVIENGGIDYYDMSSVSGGWVVPYNATISNRDAVLSNLGFEMGGGICQEKSWKYPTSNSYSYSYPSTWPAVAASSRYYPGASSHATITNGGTTSRIELGNNLPATL